MTAEQKREKVVLAYSGGLDTSVAIRWLQKKYDVDVIAVAINVGQPPSQDDIMARALRNGAVKAEYIDAKKEFVEDYIWPSLKANAMYQDVYPLSTAIARPLIVKKLIDVAHREGARYIAHGCTAKGNDQVRFDVGIMSLDPDIKVIAPMREWVLTREKEIEYAKENDIEIIVKKESPFSVDENLWGRSCECGIIEDAWEEPPADAWGWTVAPHDAPDEAEYLEIGFEKGIPVSLDGKRMDGLKLIGEVDRIARKNGVGRIDHVEDRLVGIKSRETYECPAATVLIAAHRSMEFMTLQRDVTSMKKKLEQRFSELAYDGLWFGLLRESISAFIDKTQENVTGTVRVKLYKGSVMVVGRKSPYSLYDEGLATYAEGDVYDHNAAVGFIYCWGLPNKTASRVHRKR
ncbi:MAG: argininosuccinate synthase [Candidatus Methanomethylophilaceae archaeon]|jgi:argininosuccinate synthase|nr:argininosuccinate synthase [Methanomassiliicoccales archaeon RumEn M2]MDD3128302.1 argininosuccinate synthase [Candidatus Methanomethylophilaceae archaeon]MDD4119570.1 argininosuccinate synthase [Candidatus Methanomethylophilaceae archaeon]MDD4454796.1 argininosuccinate synthase [Candidatus Methanomethylophilaceae archaeon]